MFSFEVEIRFIVIKVLRALDDTERLLRMALGAILAEFVIVNVFMATDAVFVPDPLEFLEFLPVFHTGPVTCDTGHFQVLPR